MKPLLVFRRWSLMAHWHPQVWCILPSLTVIEQRCGDPKCNSLHGIAIELGWLWGSIVFEYEL